METEQEISKGTLDEHNRSGEEDMFHNQTGAEHNHEEEEDGKDEEEQINECDDNQEYHTEMPRKIPNEYLMKCKKCYTNTGCKRKMLWLTYDKRYIVQYKYHFYHSIAN